MNFFQKRRRAKVYQWVKQKFGNEIKEIYGDVVIELPEETECDKEGRVKFVSQTAIRVEALCELFEEPILRALAQKREPTAEELVEYSKKKKIGWEKFFQRWKESGLIS